MVSNDNKQKSAKNLASTCQKLALHRYYGIVLPRRQVIEAAGDWPSSVLKGRNVDVKPSLDRHKNYSNQSFSGTEFA
jgi:hypothetical protein